MRLLKRLSLDITVGGFKLLIGIKRLIALCLRIGRTGLWRVLRLFGERPTIFLYRKFLGLHFRLESLGVPLKNPLLYALSSRSLGALIMIGLTSLTIIGNIVSQEREELIYPSNIVSHLIRSDENQPFEEDKDYATEIPVAPASISGVKAPLAVQIDDESDLPVELDSGSISLNSGSLLKPVVPSTAESTSSPDVIRTYVVQAGDSVSGIAHRFGLKTSTILWANDMSRNDTLKEGQELTILPIDGVLYRVRSGDSLTVLAQRFDANTEDIAVYNRIANSTVRIGNLIIIPGGTPSSSLAAIPTRAKSQSIVGKISNIFAKPPKILPTLSRAIGMVWPTTASRITQYFSWRHTGVDIAGPPSNRIVAADAGTVVIAQGGYNGGFGNTILIDHGNGVRTRYGHASKLYVSPGERVSKGQTIAMVGSSGRSTGPHLHFEVVVKGKKVNPLSYIR